MTEFKVGDRVHIKTDDQSAIIAEIAGLTGRIEVITPVGHEADKLYETMGWLMTPPDDPFVDVRLDNGELRLCTASMIDKHGGPEN